MNKAIDVIDKFERKQHRANGILQDGDHMNVPLKLMDSKPIIDPRLEQAMRDAHDAKRLEQFDARQHRPGPFVADTLPTADRLAQINALSDAEKARDARIKRNNDAWKHPPAVDDTEIKPTTMKTAAELEQERINKQRGVTSETDSIDHAALRDKRTSAAWQNPVSS